MDEIEQRLYAAVCLVLWMVYWSIPVIGITVAVLFAVDQIGK